MPVPELQPGDRVVDLAAMVRSVAFLAGAVGGALAAWFAKHKISYAIGLGIGVGILGFILGAAIGNMLFPAAMGQVRIVKVGPSSLPLTIRGGLVGGVAVSAIACLVTSSLLRSHIHPAIWIAVGAGAVLGVGFACLASLS